MDINRIAENKSLKTIIHNKYNKIIIINLPKPYRPNQPIHQKAGNHK